MLYFSSNVVTFDAAQRGGSHGNLFQLWSYFGPTDVDTCPDCGARLAGRIKVRALQIGALALAALGLI